MGEHVLVPFSPASEDSLAEEIPLRAEEILAEIEETEA